MATLELLPTDSVLRRHALTEQQRELGLPPSDSVLRRHYEQLQAALQGGAAALGAGMAPASSAPARPVAGTSAPLTHSAATHAQNSGGGLFGWLRRLFGA